MVVVVTGLFAVGVPMLDQGSELDQFESDSPAVEASEFITERFVTGQADGQTATQVIQRGGVDGNALSQASLVESLRLQRAIRDSPVVGPTLAPGESTVGAANALTDAAFAQRPPEERPETVSLQDRIDLLEGLSDEELAEPIQGVFGPDASPGALRLLPTSYRPGSTTADASLIVVTQQTGVGAGPGGLTDAQLEIRSLANQQESTYAVLGMGLITHEIDQSLGDSFTIVGRLALLFVVLALTVAYRDVLDILLGVLGIVAVLVWTFGFMGWTGITFNQMMIAVPVILIGLSIDYAIHVFMRHREQREEDDRRGARLAMALAVGGVGVALVWVTATAALGFLANLVSPIAPLREFGLTSAFGVFAALAIFGALVPAAKVELDTWLEDRGWSRQKRAFGTGDSRLSGVLSVGATAAQRFPVAVIVVALLVTLGGLAGATQVDTTFEQEDFLAESPPAWTGFLPGGLAPGEYQAKADLEFAQANFQQEGSQGELLIQGDVTNDQVLRWMDAASEDIAERETTFRLADGTAEIVTPLSVMRERAAANESSPFAQQFAAAAGEDGIPDRDIEVLYDALLAEEFRSGGAYVAPPETRLSERPGEAPSSDVDNGYEALRITVDLRGDASTRAAARDLRAAATALEHESGGELNVVATGEPVIFDDIESDLFETVIQGLLITMVSVFLFLSVAYRATGNPASLGVVTLLPVLFAVAWILGSMWLLSVPFNVLTGTITSLTIGLGIAYSIHISSRYELELRRQGNVWAAMRTTVTGTGGALLGSAATTVGAFGTLSLAILPVLQQFGIITGLTIVYAFLGSVLVLPSLLVLWTRYFGPTGYPRDRDRTG